MALWFEGIEGLGDAETSYIKAQGWDAHEIPAAAAAAVKAALAANAKLGMPADELVRIPKNADAAALAPVYERLGAPKDAAGYDFTSVKHADGSAASPEFVEHVRAVAHASRMTNAQAVAFAQGQLGFEGKQGADAASLRRVKAEAEIVALKATQGEQWPVYEFKARKAGELLGIGKPVWDAIEAQIGPGALFAAMATLGGKMSEADLLGPGGNGGGSRTATYTREEAQSRKASLYADETYRQRFVSGEIAAVEEMRALDRIIRGVPAR